MSDKVNFGSILKYCVVIMVSVAVVKGEDPHEMLKKALGLIGAERLISRDDTVLIKPNYVVAKHPSTGITTDSRIIDGPYQVCEGSGGREYNCW